MKHDSVGEQLGFLKDAEKIISIRVDLSPYNNSVYTKPERALDNAVNVPIHSYLIRIPKGYTNESNDD